MKPVMKSTENQETIAQTTELSNTQKPIKKSLSLSFKKKTPAPTLTDVKRFFADANVGLSKAQVQERIEQGLVNKTTKKYSKTYRSIFIGNICTFFNLLCILAAVALVAAHAPISQFAFCIIFGCNILISIMQEIRAKRKIDKLSILNLKRKPRGAAELETGGRQLK